MTARAEDRDAQVARLTDLIAGLTGPDFTYEQSRALAKRLAPWVEPIPAPPQPVNPISRETAEAFERHLDRKLARGDTSRMDDIHDALHAAAPALVADLAEAAKGEDGRIKLVDEWCGSYWFRPAALVAALTRADAGGAS